MQEPKAQKVTIPHTEGKNKTPALKVGEFQVNPFACSTFGCFYIILAQVGRVSPHPQAMKILIFSSTVNQQPFLYIYFL